MKEIGDTASAESKLLAQLNEVFSHFRVAGQTQTHNLEKGIEILQSVRTLVYENMNQLQHEALLLKTAKYLQEKVYPNVQIKWLWNPRQTGTKNEPDLQGWDNKKVIVSAEVTTSLIPQGATNKRMTTTLTKLSAMPGDKYYIIATEEMDSRAKSKAITLGYDIKVLRLSIITKID